LRVAGRIVGKDVEVIVSVGGGGKTTLLGATGVIRVGGGGDLCKVAPCAAGCGIIKLVGFTPAASILRVRPDSLAKIWRVGEPEALSRAEKLAEVGF
jgi:hypothetical protein